MRRDRGYYRYQRRKHIDRKKRIIRDLNNYWTYKYNGYLAKDKIHCSCGMCMAKTRNKKYRRRHIHGNYAPNINWKYSDLKKIDAMNYQIEDMYDETPWSWETEEEDEEWYLDANVEDTYFDGVPLDGHYLENTISSIDF